MEKFIIKCANCGKEFEPSDQVRNRIKREPDKPRFCTPKCRAEHIGNKRKVIEKYKCDLCGKEFELSQDQRLTKKDNPDKKFFCSRQCSGKYNMSSDNIKIRNEHSAQTKLERYGSSTYNNRGKAKETVRELYGTDNIFQVNQIKEKSKQTKLEKYGDINYNNRDKFRETVQNMSKEQKEAWKVNRSNSMKFIINNRTEDDWKEIKRKLSKSNSIAWGNMSDTKREKIKSTMSKSQTERWSNMSLDKKQKLFKKYRFTMLNKYGSEFNFTRKEIQDKSRLNNGHTISKVNINFKNMIKSETGIDFILEKDGYDLVYNDIAIDINPTFSHNNLLSFAFATRRSTENNPIPEDYHYKRYLKSIEMGYHLINVFDWDNIDKIIYTIQDKETLYARNLTIKEVSKDECNSFLNEFHLQNTCQGQTIKIGLYKDDQLIQIMTFGKPRYNKNCEYELLRLCTHKDYKVVGGAERLFKHFLNTYNPSSIVSYCDLSKFTGKVYTDLGFKLNSKPRPSKHWSKGKMHITDNFLRQRGYDQIFNTNYGKGTDNELLMIQNGWLPVYDCGQATYIWNKEV